MGLSREMSNVIVVARNLARPTHVVRLDARFERVRSATIQTTAAALPVNCNPTGLFVGSLSILARLSKRVLEV
jgi:hypothetical protein